MKEMLGNIKNFIPHHRWRIIFFWIAAAAVGAGGLAMAQGVHHVFHYFTEFHARWPWWPFVCLPVVGLLVTGFMKLVGPGIEGSGIQQAIVGMHVADSPAQVSWYVNLKLGLSKIVAVIITLGGGFAGGLEGPSVQVGASIMYAFRRFLPGQTEVTRRQLIMVGGAAGIAAAFSAPIAGMMFAFEELGRGFNKDTNARMAIAVVLAGMIAYSVQGRNYYGSVTYARGFPGSVLLVLLCVAVAGALVGTLFSWMVIRANRWLPKGVLDFRAKHPFIFVLICALFICCLGLIAPIFGPGTDLTAKLLSRDAQVAWYYLPLKFLAVIASILARVPGGIFAPALSMGAGVGSWFINLAGPEWNGHIMAIGMASVLSGITRSPLTAAFIVIEVTAGQTAILEILAGAFLGAYLAQVARVNYDHELAQRAYDSMPMHLKKSNPDHPEQMAPISPT